jgi:hypothetical protein
MQVLEYTHPHTGIGGDISKPNFLTPTAFRTGFIHLVSESDFPRRQQQCAPTLDMPGVAALSSPPFTGSVGDHIGDFTSSMGIHLCHFVQDQQAITTFLGQSFQAIIGGAPCIHLAAHHTRGNLQCRRLALLAQPVVMESTGWFVQ